MRLRDRIKGQDNAMWACVPPKEILAVTNGQVKTINKISEVINSFLKLLLLLLLFWFED